MRTRLNPPAANSNDRALPMPEDAPVMMAHLPLIEFVETLIAGAEHIRRVEGLLQLPFPLKRGFRHDPRQERAAQFSHTVMVRERTAGLQDFIAPYILQFEIHVLGI